MITNYKLNYSNYNYLFLSVYNCLIAFKSIEMCNMSNVIITFYGT